MSKGYVGLPFHKFEVNDDDCDAGDITALIVQNMLERCNIITQMPRVYGANHGRMHTGLIKSKFKAALNRIIT